MNVNFLTARVNAPSGNHTDAQIIETEDGNHSIRFVPKVSIYLILTYIQTLTNRKPVFILSMSCTKTIQFLVLLSNSLLVKSEQVVPTKSPLMDQVSNVDMLMFRPSSLFQLVKPVPVD